MMDALIKGITQIANNKELIEKLEPNVFSHQEIKGWMVKRILMAYQLLENEWEMYDTNKRVKEEQDVSKNPRG